MSEANELLRRFVDQPTVVLTTFRKNGDGVPTAVNIAVDGDRAFVKTWSASGKYKRIRNDPRVTVAPSTLRGKPTGSEIEMTARMLGGADRALAQRLIEQKHPILQRILIRIGHRLQRAETVFMELRPR